MFRIGSDKKANRLFFFFAFAYFTDYLMRYDYGAALSEIITQEGIQKSSAGLVSTALFFAYGLGQIISGVLGDRVKPYKLVFGGLLSAAIVNLLMPLAGSVTMMTVLWAINGFASSMLWPPIVRMMAENFDTEEYRVALVNISLACAAGTILVYLLAPVCIWISGWKLLFYVVGVLGTVVAIGWISYVPSHQIGKGKYEPKEKTNPEKTTSHTRDLSIGYLFGIAGVFPVLLAIISQGTIRDGVSTWVPKMLAEIFTMPDSSSILITVLLPILTFIALKITDYLYVHFFPNEVDCASVLFLTSFIACGALVFVSKWNVVLTLVLSGIAVSAIHGVNMMLINRMPGYFGKYGKISTVAGIMNTFTYVGSAASTYGFAIIQERFGWTVLIITWVALDAVGLITLAIARNKWKKFIED